MTESQYDAKILELGAAAFGLTDGEKIWEYAARMLAPESMLPWNNPDAARQRLLLLDLLRVRKTYTYQSDVAPGQGASVYYPQQAYSYYNTLQEVCVGLGNMLDADRVFHNIQQLLDRVQKELHQK